MNRKQAIMRMIHVPGMGVRTVGRLLRKLALEGRSPSDFLASTASELVSEYGLSGTIAAALGDENPAADRLAAQLDEHEVALIDIAEPAYPALLAARLGRTAPPILFTHGDADLLHRPIVGMAGSRNCLPESLETSHRTASALCRHGLSIAAGYAPGVDTAAHHSALSSDGATILVLASGILHYSPKGDLAAFMEESNSLIVSEFFPTLPWKSHSAMTRNRTIAGLSKALIVVEAAADSGSFAAGKAAVEIGCPLFVVNHPKVNPEPEGNRVLLERGGQSFPVTDTGDPDESAIRNIVGIDPTAFKPQSSLFD